MLEYLSICYYILIYEQILYETELIWIFRLYFFTKKKNLKKSSNFGNIER